MQVLSNLSRRQIIRFLLLFAGASFSVADVARAQSYPARPLRILVGYAPGGVNDILARLAGQWLSDRLGQPVVVENRSGAASNIATEMVVRAPNDGYTLLLAGTSNVINTSLYSRLNFNFSTDIDPVATISRIPYVLVVNPQIPALSIEEFIAHAKSRPGRISMASAGHGSPTHVAGELFKMMSSIDLLHVPYKGGSEALADVLAGHVQIYFASTASAMEYVKSGKLRALGVTSVVRVGALPEIAPIADSLPGYEASSWYGLVAPKGTPADIIDRLQKEISAGLTNEKFVARLTALGGTPLTSTPTEFGRLIGEETEKWHKVVKFSGAKVE